MMGLESLYNNDGYSDKLLKTSPTQEELIAQYTSFQWAVHNQKDPLDAFLLLACEFGPNLGVFGMGYSDLPENKPLLPAPFDNNSSLLH